MIKFAMPQMGHIQVKEEITEEFIEEFIEEDNNCTTTSYRGDDLQSTEMPILVHVGSYITPRPPAEVYALQAITGVEFTDMGPGQMQRAMNHVAQWVSNWDGRPTRRLVDFEGLRLRVKINVRGHVVICTRN